MIPLEQSHIATGVFSGQRDAMLSKEGLECKHWRHRPMIDGCACPVEHDGPNVKRIFHALPACADKAQLR